SVVAQAIEHWRAAGVDPGRLSALDHANVHVANLYRGELGLASAWGEVWIDRTAAGWGWSLDANPAQGRMDLLTVVTHELGHVLGFEHGATGVMEANLSAGVRLLPAPVALGEPPAATPGLVARASAVTSGFTASPSSVTVSDHGTPLTPHSGSLVIVVSP